MCHPTHRSLLLFCVPRIAAAVCTNQPGSGSAQLDFCLMKDRLSIFRVDNPAIGFLNTLVRYYLVGFCNIGLHEKADSSFTYSSTERLPFFFRRVMVASVFFRITVSIISLEQKTNKRRGKLSVGWLVHDKRRVKKSPPNA